MILVSLATNASRATDYYTMPSMHNVGGASGDIGGASGDVGGASCDVGGTHVTSCYSSIQSYMLYTRSDVTSVEAVTVTWWQIYVIMKWTS